MRNFFIWTLPAMIGLVIAAMFNGYFLEKPVLGGVMGVSYLFGARHLWKMADLRKHD